MRGMTPNHKPLHQLKSYRWGEKEFLQRLGQILRQRGQSLNQGRPPSVGIPNSQYRYSRGDAGQSVQIHLGNSEQSVQIQLGNSQSSQCSLYSRRIWNSEFRH